MTRKAARLRELRGTHLECRVWGHAWEHDETEVAGRALVLWLICGRCEAHRIDQVERRSGRLLARAYVHPEGYLVGDLASWGGRRVLNENLRIELYARLAQATPRRGLRAVGGNE